MCIFPLMIINKHGLELTFERIKIIADFRFQIFRVPGICLTYIYIYIYSHKDIYSHSFTRGLKTSNEKHRRPETHTHSNIHQTKIVSFSLVHWKIEQMCTIPWRLTDYASLIRCVCVCLFLCFLMNIPHCHIPRLYTFNGKIV